MSPRQRFNSYQKQAILSASPEQLVAKLYDLGIGACHQDDRYKLRAVLKELMSSLNMDQGGEMAERLYALYAFCIDQSAGGDLEPVIEILGGLREAWKSSVLTAKAA
jgi:flagellar protein FliS